MSSIKVRVYRSYVGQDGDETWSVDYREPSGRRVRRAIGRRDEAELVAARVRTELFSGRYYPERYERQQYTLARLYQRQAETGRRSASDLAQLRAAVEFLGPSTPVASLTARDIERWREHLATQRPRSRGGRTLSTATLNRYMASLKTALNLAVRDGKIPASPARHVSQLAEHNARDRIMSPEEEERILAECSAEMRLAVVLAVETGMRAGEVFGLRWSQIDLAGRVVRLAAAETKARKARTVPLSQRALDALTATPRRIDGRVFATRAKTVSNRWELIAARAGAEGLLFHDLRHTWATRARRGGMDIVTLKAIGGWATWSMVERYQTITEDDLVAAVDALRPERPRRSGIDTA